MPDVSGKTSNGFSYEGDFQLPRTGRVNWSVTFRQNGDFAGMRHGCVHGMQDVDAAALEEAVKRDIDATWTQPG